MELWYRLTNQIPHILSIFVTLPLGEEYYDTTKQQHIVMDNRKHCLNIFFESINNTVEHFPKGKMNSRENTRGYHLADELCEKDHFRSVSALTRRLITSDQQDLH